MNTSYLLPTNPFESGLRVSDPAFRNMLNQMASAISQVGDITDMVNGVADRALALAGSAYNRQELFLAKVSNVSGAPNYEVTELSTANSNGAFTTQGGGRVVTAKALNGRTDLEVGENVWVMIKTSPDGKASYVCMAEGEDPDQLLCVEGDYTPESGLSLITTVSEEPASGSDNAEKWLAVGHMYEDAGGKYNPFIILDPDTMLCIDTVPSSGGIVDATVEPGSATSGDIVVKGHMYWDGDGKLNPFVVIDPNDLPSGGSGTYTAGTHLTLVGNQFNHDAANALTSNTNGTYSDTYFNSANGGAAEAGSNISNGFTYAISQNYDWDFDSLGHERQGGFTLNGAAGYVALPAVNPAVVPSSGSLLAYNGTRWEAEDIGDRLTGGTCIAVTGTQTATVSIDFDSAPVAGDDGKVFTLDWNAGTPRVSLVDQSSVGGSGSSDILVVEGCVAVTKQSGDTTLTFTLDSSNDYRHRFFLRNSRAVIGNAIPYDTYQGASTVTSADARDTWIGDATGGSPHYTLMGDSSGGSPDFYVDTSGNLKLDVDITYTTIGVTRYYHYHLEFSGQIKAATQSHP